MQRILVTGASGFLGSRIVAHYQGKYDVYAPRHAELDITDAEMVAAKVEDLKPHIIIHCAAISDVGRCEKEPDKSWQINVDGSINIARASAAVGAKCLICSSDQVYFGEPVVMIHNETEKLEPINLYGKEKLRAEEECLRVNSQCIMLRLSWMYDISTLNKAEHGDFVRTLLAKMQAKEMLSYPLHDIRGITPVSEVIKNLEKAFSLEGGIYNFGCSNDMNTYETVLKLFSGMGWDISCVKKNEAAFSENPRNISMSQHKINNCGIEFPSTLEGLLRSLEKVKLTAS